MSSRVTGFVAVVTGTGGVNGLSWCRVDAGIIGREKLDMKVTDLSTLQTQTLPTLSVRVGMSWLTFDDV